jgi:cytochrome c biogenesis protein CcdA
MALEFLVKRATEPLSILMFIASNLIYMGTLGKAAGVAGAFVVAERNWIHWLIQKLALLYFQLFHLLIRPMLYSKEYRDYD